VNSFSKSIKGNNLGVRYDESVALENVTVEIKKGECLAIVGRTGAGKTTLTNVILKFKFPDEGDVLLDLRELNEIETNAYRKLIVPVLQEPFLFNGTVFENVEYSKRGITKEEVQRLIDVYGMSEIFRNLPKGIESPVGEMGRNMSEGQRQAVFHTESIRQEPRNNNHGRGDRADRLKSEKQSSQR